MALSLAGDGTLSGVDIAASGLGRVLQVVRATDSTSRSTTSTSFVDVTGMSVTITPTKATSAIILAALCRANTGSAVFYLTITDSSNNPISGFESLELGTGGTSRNQVNHWAYATPATTSATTYKLRFRVASGTVNIANDEVTGQMYAIEVAA